MFRHKHLERAHFSHKAHLLRGNSDVKKKTRALRSSGEKKKQKTVSSSSPPHLVDLRDNGVNNFSLERPKYDSLVCHREGHITCAQYNETQILLVQLLKNQRKRSAYLRNECVTRGLIDLAKAKTLYWGDHDDEAVAACAGALNFRV